MINPFEKLSIPLHLLTVILLVIVIYLLLQLPKPQVIFLPIVPHHVEEIAPAEKLFYDV